MVFRMLRGIAAAAVALFAMVGSASAVTTYTYTGNPLTSSTLGVWPDGAAVTAEIIVKEALAANTTTTLMQWRLNPTIYNVDSNFISATLNDGLKTYFVTPNTGSSSNVWTATVRVTTNALGSIVQWDLSASWFPIGQGENVQGWIVGSSNQQDISSAPGSHSANSRSPGSWASATTVVPLPAGGFFLLSALVALLLLRQRSRHSSLARLVVETP